MKKLRFSTVIILLSVLSMGMGFPDIVSDREDEGDTIEAKKAQQLIKTQAIACSRRVYSATKAKRQTMELDNKKQQIHTVSTSLCEKTADSINIIALKLFDNKGNILLIENIQIADLFRSDYPAQKLPAGSTFVMFYANTAYYYLDKEEIDDTHYACM